MSPKKKMMKINRPALPPVPGRQAIGDPMRFLAESGLLGHINVAILHPLGLGLVADRDPATGEIRAVQLEDNRSNPVVVLSPEQFRDYRGKLEAYLRECGTATMTLRERRIGFVVQKK